MNEKEKLERELGGLRSDRKKVVERMDSYIQVENMGQYTILPLPKKEETFTKRDLVVGAVAFGAGYLLADMKKKKKDSGEEDTSAIDEIIDEVQRDMKGEEQESEEQ